MAKKIQMPVGARFGRLTIIGEAPNAGSATQSQVRCDCGVTLNARNRDLREGHTRSCGCLKKPPAAQRFWSFVKIAENGCWLWQGSLNPHGYADFQSEGFRSGHSWSYNHFIGSVAEGEQLDHLCRNRGCVNPNHLEPVTQRENLRRGKRENQYTKRTHCRKGHEYTPETTQVTENNGRTSRMCLICRRASTLASVHRHRAKKREETN